MLKTEENAKYRLVLKNVLEFNPEILRRFVNFMNNPDEETAVVQFGKGDKYFGICLLMVTLPGMPMFGHGQIEGFAEKYGMEYRRAYWHEETDWDFVKRHEDDIFPIMKKRHLFSSVENFVLYDFFSVSGHVDENVFVYSNCCGEEKALILYNNSYQKTVGWIRSSCAFSVPVNESGERKLIHKTLGEGLGLKNDPNYYYIFKDHSCGLEYIRSGNQLCDNGLYSELKGYQYHTFIDFREVQDTHLGYYGKLCCHLNGKGVVDIEIALQEMIFAPVHLLLQNLIARDQLQALFKSKINMERKSVWQTKVAEFIRTVAHFVGCGQSEETEKEIVESIVSDLVKLIDLKLFLKNKSKLEGCRYLASRSTDKIDFWQIPCVWSLLYQIGKIRIADKYPGQSIALWDELLLDRAICIGMEKYQYAVADEQLLIKILITHSGWGKKAASGGVFSLVHEMFSDSDVQKYLGFNYHNGVLWLGKEQLEYFCYWLLLTSAIPIFNQKQMKKVTAAIEINYKIIKQILAKAEKASYKVEGITASLKR